MITNQTGFIPTLIKIGVSSLLTAGLVGCGGGGSSAPTAPTITGTAEGVYVGTTSNGYNFDALVLENGTYYSLYGVPSGSALYAYGFSTGTGVSNNGNFTSSNLIDFFHTGAIYTGSLNATYVPGSRINGSTIESGTPGTFTGTVPASSSYVYTAAANLANIAGAWTLTDLQGAAVSMTIANNGTFTATSGGCSFSGSLTPRASGKNVFDLAITFGAPPCALPSQTASGIAVEYLLTGGLRQFIMAGTNSGQTAGTAAFGTR